MRTRILALTGALVLIAAFPAVAGTNKFSKSLKGGGKVSFKIKTNKKGVATKATSIKVTGLPTKCGNGFDPAAPGPAVGESLGSAKIAKQKLGGSTTYLFNVNKRVNNRGWTVSGTLKSKKGRSITEGQVAVQFVNGSLDCSNSVQFKAKRK